MFNKKKPINKLQPFNTTGAPLQDNTAYVPEKKKSTAANAKKKPVKKK